MPAFTIGRLAKAADVNIETIRHYQRQQLINTPEKPLGGFRHYPDNDVDRIRFIKRAQQLGFSLKEIRELLNLRSDSTANCDEMCLLTEKKSRKFRERITI